MSRAWRRLPRILLTLVLATLAVFAGWRVIVTTLADQLADADPQAALRWQPEHPTALLALAERQLADGDAQAASATARRLLQVEPLHGRAFAILARASEATANPAAVSALHAIAARRAPRVPRPHAWLAEYHLQAGRYDKALAQIDMILRLSPNEGAHLLPLLAQWSADPDFASALATQLRTDPVWRPHMLQTLSSQVDSAGTNVVYAALRRQGGLSEAEAGHWLNALIQAGRWGQAYSHWASGLALPEDAVLPTVHNGGFESPPSGVGFDWRVGHVPGTITEFEPATGASGNQAAHVSFRGRPVPGGNLEQALLLAPGPHRLTMRMRAQALRSDQGLHWTLTCDGQPRPFAIGEALDGSFGWRRFALEFDVPPTHCEGQWIKLANPAPGGSASTVSGDLWIDDVAIDGSSPNPLDGPGPAETP